ncbi:MAG: hypothetical protein WBL65_10345, partial [Bryobacteraceae bacterium]
MIRNAKPGSDPGSQADVHAVVATSAGKAINILSHDSGPVYAGIVLDFDLQLRRAAASELHLCEHDVVLAIIEHISRDARILVHSESASQSPLMVRSLRQAGFDVTQIPMHLLTADSLQGLRVATPHYWKNVELNIFPGTPRGRRRLGAVNPISSS